MKRMAKFLGVVLLAGLLLVGCSNKTAQGAANTNTGKTLTNPATVSQNVQTVTTKFSSRSYAPITVQAGVPVRWTIQLDAKDLNGCNNEMVIPEYNITQPLQAGETVVEFTPTAAGTIPYSCWMGMIRSQIIVVDSLGETTPPQPSNEAEVNNTAATAYNQLTLANPSQETSELSIAIASIENRRGTVAIPMGQYGYGPDVVLVQRGVETDFQFDTLARSCASELYFPQISDKIDIAQTPTVTVVPEEDFTIQCTMGMYVMNVLVVDDLTSPETQALLDDITANPETYRPQTSGCSFAGTGANGPGGSAQGGCCGRG